MEACILSTISPPALRLDLEFNHKHKTPIRGGCLPTSASEVDAKFQQSNGGPTKLWMGKFVEGTYLNWMSTWHLRLETRPILCRVIEQIL